MSDDFKMPYWITVEKDRSAVILIKYGGFMERYIFLDTNIYINAGYSFGSMHMKKFSELVSNDGLVLLTCSICIGEVEKHIKTDLERAVRELNKALQKREFAALRNHDLYKEKLAEMDETHAIDAVIKSFHDFLNQNRAESFLLQEIDMEEIMQDYFEKKAPFETQKPNEFKDAIMIKALKNYQKRLNKRIIVISSDKGFRNAFLGNDKFLVFERLIDFLHYQQRTDSIHEAFENYFENDFEYESIQEQLDDLLKNITYSFDEREEFEVVDIETEDISYEFNYAEVKDDGDAQAFLTAYFYLRMKSRYLDTNNSYYDKEDDEYIVKSYIESEEIHRFEHEIVLDFEFDESEMEKEEARKYKLTFIGVCADMCNMFVDLSEDDTLFDCIDSMSVMREKDKQWLEKNVVKCSECGKILGFNDLGNYHDYKGEPICARCAVTNEQGFICPSCGYKHPYERMGNSGTFCIDCELEYED